MLKNLIDLKQFNNIVYTLVLHCKKNQAVSTNYYLVTSSTEILRSVNFWLQSVAWIVIF